MPFVTEEIWQRFGIGETIVRAPWPEAAQFQDHETELGGEAQSFWPFIEELVTTVRRFRSDHRIPAKAELELRLVERGAGPPLAAAVGAFEREVRRLVGASRIAYVDPQSDAPGYARLVVQGETVLIPVSDLIDLEAERTRLGKRLEEAEEELRMAGSKLANPGFLEKAPEDVVLDQKMKVERVEREAGSLREQLAELG
jgi:valyl-tRNA synthetase